MNKFLITLFITGLFAISAKSQTYPVSSIPQNLLDNANAVVRLDETIITVEDQRTITKTTTYSVTVMNKQGDRYVRDFQHYDPERKIKDLDLYIYDANGKELEHYKQRDFNDISAISSGSLYQDSRVKVVSYTPTSYPYTAVFNSEVQGVNTAFIQPWSPVSAGYVAVEKSKYVLHVPSSLGLRVKEENLENYTVEKTTIGDGVVFTATNIPAIKPESYSPPDDTLYPKVIFGLNKFHLEGVDGEASDWASFGKWRYDKLLDGTADLPEATKVKMRSLVADKASDYEKAKAVYEYVQQNTRYISIQEGIGGWRPMKASEVDKLGYGDCKALTNYTMNLLDAVGINAYYTIVYSGREKRSIEDDFYSMQGNHIILDIPIDGSDVWIDCTSQELPFNFIGDFTDDRNALALTPDGGKIVKTKAYLNDENKQVITADCKIDAEGWLEANVNVEDYGITYDRSFGIQFMDSDDKEKYYKRYWGNLNDLRVVGVDFENDKEQVKLTEKVKVDVPNIISFTGDTGLLIPNFFNNSINVPDRYRNRTTPFYISRGFEDIDTYTIQLPEGVTVDYVPEAVKESNDYGSYEMHIEQQGNTLVYCRKMSLNAGTYPKDKYSDFRNFMRLISKSDNAKVVLKK